MDEKNEKTVMTKDQAVEVIKAAIAGTLAGRNQYELDEKVRAAELVLRLHAIHGAGEDPAVLFKRDHDALHERHHAEIEDRKAHAALMRALVEAHEQNVELNKRFVTAMEQLAAALSTSMTTIKNTYGASRDSA